MALLTTAQAAERLNISHRAMRYLVLHGRVPAIRIGRNWVIDEVDLANRPPLEGPPKAGRPRVKPKKEKPQAAKKEKGKKKK